MMSTYHNVLELIGNTPLLAVKHLDTGCCELFLKLENQNPGGSTKDRIALRMVEQAEQDGLLQPGGTLIEATAGNTGLGLALVAAVKGYHCLIVMPDKMSKEKIVHLRALGAQVIMTRSDVAKGHPDYYQDVAARLATTTPNSYYINQFANVANVQAHTASTGPEIWQQMQHDIDAFVAGVGTGGTITGVGRFLRTMNPQVELILADPQGSILADYVNHGSMGQATSWLVEGIGEDFIPSISDMSLLNRAITVSDKEAFLAARDLLAREGILAGSSTGVLLHAALLYCRAQSQPKRVVTLVCDTGNKYLSKFYNDVWMRDHGFLPTSQYGDLRDVIAYPHASKACITVADTDTLATAHKRMYDHHISQLPVLREQQYMGLLHINDVLRVMQQGADALKQCVADALVVDERAHLAATASLTALQAALEQQPCVAIVQDGVFYGVLTAIDVVNFLKRRVS